MNDRIIIIDGEKETKIDRLCELTGGIVNRTDHRKELISYIRYLETSDEETFIHSVNVSALCSLFGYWINMKQDETILLTVSGMLHDIGKIQMPVYILGKRGPLSAEERIIINTHTNAGYDMLKNLDLFEEVKLTALCHHEKTDGSGYPLGITGSKINKFASIVSICDIYDAMTADRRYRKKVSPFKVIQTFEAQTYGGLKAEYVTVFLQNIAQTLLNRRAKLSDGRECRVVLINDNNLSKPVVKCGNDVIDLSVHKELDIQEVS